MAAPPLANRHVGHRSEHRLKPVLPETKESHNGDYLMGS
jgi:hypothetical protein